jgi:periplasmic copper chaperone A
MSKRLAVVGTATLGVTAAIVLGTAGVASAHVSATATSTAANSYTTATFSVPHGCDGSPTTKITFQVPESIIEVTPTVNPNWTITKTTEPYTSASSSADDEAEDAAERVTSVTYTAKTPLPADERDTFQLSFSLPDGKAGDLVEFPALQTCERGTVEWNQEQQAGEAEPEHPAPSITLTAADTTGDEDGHGGSATTAAAAGDGTSTPADPDLVGRFLGLGGLVLGAVALVVAVAGTRRRSASK